MVHLCVCVCQDVVESRRIRQEQDDLFAESLKIDQKKDRMKRDEEIRVEVKFWVVDIKSSDAVFLMASHILCSKSCATLSQRFLSFTMG